MGLYGGGGTTVNYQAPVIPKDDTFANFLKYQQEKEDRADVRAAAEKLEQKTLADARKTAATNAYSGMRSGVEAQLRQGLISYGDATSQLRDYSAKYDLAPPEEDVTNLTNIYTQELLPGRRTAGIASVYEEMLGRPGTEEEKSKALEQFNQGVYSTTQDFRDAISRSSEYQKKFNQSYLDNYYDTQFGSSIEERTEKYVDSDTKEEKTRVVKTRKFNFDPALLPKYNSNVEGRTGVAQPDYEKYFGTARSVQELEEGIQGIRDTRKYLYSAGLTNLQGEIDKETQKLKNEGSKEVAKIGATGNVYSNLVSGFWS